MLAAKMEWESFDTETLLFSVSGLTLQRGPWGFQAPVASRVPKVPICEQTRSLSSG